MSKRNEISADVGEVRTAVADYVKTSPYAVRKSRYTLEELLEGHTVGRPFSAEEKAWENAPPVGNEIW